VSTRTRERTAVGGRPPYAFVRRVGAAGLPWEQAPDPVSEADLADLPPAVVRYLRAMGVVGRPPARSLQAHFVGRFRRRRDQAWMPCDAWQYNTAPGIARLFRMRLMVAGVVPMWGWDTYREGRGRMLGKALGVVTVADGSGPEFDTGELVTWLNDAVLMAPSMLLTTRTSWDDMGEDSFRVSVSDAGRTVAAEVFLGGDDLPRDFVTDDRYADLPGGLVRATWSTPVPDWVVADGRPRPTGGAAVWHLPEGEFRYGELRLVELALDVPPGRRDR